MRLQHCREGFTKAYSLRTSYNLYIYTVSLQPTASLLIYSLLAKESSASAMAGEAGVWSFGYGSNMDMAALQGKKGVRVLRHCAAVLQGYTLAFGMDGLSHVEPGFACLRKAEGDEVHGVAFCMGAESVAVLDKAEGNGTAYVKETVELAAYTGEHLEAFIYVNPRDTGANFPPSRRYLGVLCKGARQAGLQDEYIAKLEQRPVYDSGLVEKVVAARRAREARRARAATRAGAACRDSPRGCLGRARSRGRPGEATETSCRASPPTKYSTTPSTTPSSCL